ncbi:MAG UNVERIFIED_CONTAM: cell division/cell wall cluster transcriptional repressor MraZ [Rickettsiaceae bacterium]|jgi:MraZ protein
MQIFLSKYLNNIDKKSRISVPSNYRLVLNNQNGLIIYPSIKHKCLEACSTDRLQELSKIIEALDPYSEERDAFETTILGESMHLAFDSEGRITLPKSLSDYANLNDKAYFVGKGLVFEIWNPEAFETYLSKATNIAKSNRHLLKNIGVGE